MNAELIPMPLTEEEKPTVFELTERLARAEKELARINEALQSLEKFERRAMSLFARR
jgi:hypothetical protein